jgi:hypothetical protein
MYGWKEEFGERDGFGDVWEDGRREEETRS